MLFIIANLLIKLFGIDFAKANRIARWLFAGIAILVVLIIAGLVFKACGGRKVKIDQKETESIAKANEADRKKELEVSITRNADAVKTVNGRNTIAEVNEANKQSEIYLKIKDADEKIAASKASGHDVTGDEVNCLLTGEDCK